MNSFFNLLLFLFYCCWQQYFRGSKNRGPWTRSMFWWPGLWTWSTKGGPCFVIPRNWSNFFPLKPVMGIYGTKISWEIFPKIRKLLNFWKWTIQRKLPGIPGGSSRNGKFSVKNYRTLWYTCTTTMILLPSSCSSSKSISLLGNSVEYNASLHSSHSSGWKCWWS